MKKNPTWKQLREEFPFVPISEFSRKADMIKLSELDEEELEILRLLLADKNEEGRRAEEAEDNLIRSRLKKVTASLLHHQLDISVPAGIDKEHVQAYIVYGLLIPGNSRTFAGKRKTTLPLIRRFVRGKLGPLFDSEKFSAVHTWLIKTGAISEKLGISLQTKADSRYTAEGKAIVDSAKRFMLKFL